MSQLQRDHVTNTEIADPRWKNLYTIGAIAALLQLAAILALIVVQAALGPKPASAEEYFVVQQSSALAAMLRGDFLLLFLIGGYLGTFPALYMALRRISPTAVLLATISTLMTVAMSFAAESSFSLLHLGSQYAAATSEAVRAQLVAAGQAVIASDMWNSSGAYMGGILLQGSGVIISLVMLRSRDFSKVTAIAGLLGNAIDLVQHIIHPMVPSVSDAMKMVMGPFYFVWFPMLAWDLFRLAKTQVPTGKEAVQ
jgi:hypothetical protein